MCVMLVALAVLAQRDKKFVIESFNDKRLISAFGEWSVHNDAPNRGKSLVLNADSLIQSENENPYISVRYMLDKGDFQWLPYVNITFEFGKTKWPVNWNIAKTIAYRYKGAAHQFMLPTSNIEDYAYYQISVPESKEWITVNIKISELKQPTWGKRVPFEPKKVFAILWQRNGNDGENGIMSIDDLHVSEE